MEIISALTALRRFHDGSSQASNIPDWQQISISLKLGFVGFVEL